MGCSVCRDAGSKRNFGQLDCDQLLVQFNEKDSSQPDHMQPEHVRTCKQVTCAMASAISSADRRIMARAVRMSVAVDDCDQTRVMLFKMVTANPIVQVHSCVASVLRDPGHGVDDAVAATMTGIGQACHIRVGPLCKDTLEGQSCYIDRSLEKHVCNVMTAAASDGCEVEVQAVQKLRATNRLPNLRYFEGYVSHTRNDKQDDLQVSEA